MNFATRMMGVCLGFLTLLGVSRAMAQDWPQWRGPNRDGKTTGFKVPATWPATLTKQWDVVVGNGVASPSLFGDRLYVISREGENEVVRCLDAATGNDVWKDSYPSAPATGPGSGGGRFIGARSTPTVADGRVVTLGVNGLLSCYDAASGAVKWREDEFVGQVPGFFASSSPIVVDGMCIAQLGAGGGEGARPGDIIGAMVAYDLATGDEKWRAANGSPAYSSPVSMNVDGMKVVVALSETNLVAINTANGKVVWQIPYTQGRYNAATPIVDGQTLIFAGPGSGMTAVTLAKEGDAFTESEAWRYTDSSVIFNTPVLKDGALYGISTRDEIFAVNAEHVTGWTAPVGAPAGVGRLAPAAEPTVFAQQPGEGRGRGAARGGQGRGRGRRGGGRSRRPGGGGERPGYGSIVDVGSVMLALTPGADLVVFRPNADEYTEVARYKVSEDGDAYSHPIPSGNRIYIKDRDSVSMWTVD